MGSQPQMHPRRQLSAVWIVPCEFPSRQASRRKNELDLPWTLITAQNARGGQVIVRVLNFSADRPSPFARVWLVLLWILALVILGLFGWWIQREFFTPRPVNPDPRRSME